MDKKFVLESKSNDGRFGTPDTWRAESIPLSEEEANAKLKQREEDVTIYDGEADFRYRLVELKEEKPKKKKKVKKKS